MPPRLSVLLAFVLAASCVPKTGRLESNRYQHEEHPYAVFYEASGTPEAPFGNAFRVANFTRAEAQYLPNNAPEFMVTRRYDLDGDGKPEVREQEPFFDLLLTHAQRDGRLWVRTVPIAPNDAEEALSVLAERYIEGAARTGDVEAPFGTELATSSHPLTSRVLNTQACTLSKREAVRVDFELSGPGANVQRGGVVLVRSGYARRVASAGRHRDYPVVLLVGMRTQPSEAALIGPDFERLMERTVLGELGRGLSMNGAHSCGWDAATSGAEAPPAEAAESARSNDGEEEEQSAEASPDASASP